jgi:hypothetical protein
MKRLSVSLFLLIALSACNRGGSTITSESPAAGSSPAPISSSADVVKIKTESVPVAADGNVDAKIWLSIAKGFHVNANPATFPYLIATQVTPGKVDGIKTGNPVYPVAEKKKFQFADQPLAVYEGEVLITLNVAYSAQPTGPGAPRSLPITVLVQACDEEKCYPPATVKSIIELTVK